MNGITLRKQNPLYTQCGFHSTWKSLLPWAGSSRQGSKHFFSPFLYLAMSFPGISFLVTEMQDKLTLDEASKVKGPRESFRLLTLISPRPETQHSRQHIPPCPEFSLRLQDILGFLILNRVILPCCLHRFSPIWNQAWLSDARWNQYPQFQVNDFTLC